MYLENCTEDVPAYASPALTEDLHDLPPAYICVGTLDSFCDETIAYAHKLIDSGVPTELHVYPGCFHGFENFAANTKIGRRAIQEYLRALKEALA